MNKDTVKRLTKPKTRVGPYSIPVEFYRGRWTLSCARGSPIVSNTSYAPQSHDVIVREMFKSSTSELLSNIGGVVSI